MKVVDGFLLRNTTCLWILCIQLSISLIIHVKLLYIFLKDGSVLFNDALNTFSYGYMASDIYF